MRAAIASNSAYSIENEKERDKPPDDIAHERSQCTAGETNDPGKERPRAGQGSCKPTKTRTAGIHLGAVICGACIE